MKNTDLIAENGVIGGETPINEQTPSSQDHSQNMLKPQQNTSQAEDRKEIYAHIEKLLGKETADKWLHETLKHDYSTLKHSNKAHLKELATKYDTFLQIPEISEAVADFLGSDVNHSTCLKGQNVAKAFEHIVNVYQSGYNAAQGVKNQNDSAKSRMISSINQLQPAISRGKVFSRADIKSMSATDYTKNEKAIFDQMSKGLIK